MENFIFCAVSVWSFWWKKFFLFLQEKLDYRCLTRIIIIIRDYVNLTVLLKTNFVEKLKKKNISENKS